MKIPCDAEPGQTWNFNELSSDDSEMEDESGSTADSDAKAGLWVYYDYQTDAFAKAVVVQFKVLPEGGENPN